MKKSYYRSRRGSSTGLPFVIGLLTLLFLFLGGRSTSSNPAIAITNLLTAKGYSSNVAKWWTAVSNFETAKWTSKLFRMANNLFGMKQPKSRMTLSTGPSIVEGEQWATFSSVEDSVKDLILYMENFNYPKDFESLEAMVFFMKGAGYFQEDPIFYLNGVKSRL
jgi:hypothetical protein